MSLTEAPWSSISVPIRASDLTLGPMELHLCPHQGLRPHFGPHGAPSLSPSGPQTTLWAPWRSITVPIRASDLTLGPMELHHCPHQGLIPHFGPHGAPSLSPSGPQTSLWAPWSSITVPTRASDLTLGPMELHHCPHQGLIPHFGPHGAPSLSPSGPQTSLWAPWSSITVPTRASDLTLGPMELHHCPHQGLRPHFGPHGAPSLSPSGPQTSLWAPWSSITVPIRASDHTLGPMEIHHCPHQGLRPHFGAPWSSITVPIRASDLTLGPMELHHCPHQGLRPHFGPHGAPSLSPSGPQTSLWAPWSSISVPIRASDLTLGPMELHLCPHQGLRPHFGPHGAPSLSPSGPQTSLWAPWSSITVPIRASDLTLGPMELHLCPHQGLRPHFGPHGAPSLSPSGPQTSLWAPWSSITVPIRASDLTLGPMELHLCPHQGLRPHFGPHGAPSLSPSGPQTSLWAPWSSISVPIRASDLTLGPMELHLCPHQGLRPHFGPHGAPSLSPSGPQTSLWAPWSSITVPIRASDLTLGPMELHLCPHQGLRPHFGPHGAPSLSPSGPQTSLWAPWSSISVPIRASDLTLGPMELHLCPHQGLRPHFGPHGAPSLSPSGPQTSLWAPWSSISVPIRASDLTLGPMELHLCPHQGLRPHFGPHGAPSLSPSGPQTSLWAPWSSITVPIRASDLTLGPMELHICPHQGLRPHFGPHGAPSLSPSGPQTLTLGPMELHHCPHQGLRPHFGPHGAPSLSPSGPQTSLWAPWSSISVPIRASDLTLGSHGAPSLSPSGPQTSLWAPWSSITVPIRASDPTLGPMELHLCPHQGLRPHFGPHGAPSQFK
ncbi:hypothetical protein CesoFtcFv8_025105 [Champsocephalus esox]|nr:hypothetical protein CesoFtcFv8_025105 [Champsocephalus esox]